MKRNQLTLELIHTQIREDELCHMTPEEKKAYNAQYYQRNKEKYWGVRGNRPMARPKLYREDMIVEGRKPSVHRRGEGLGTGPVGSTGYRPTTAPVEEQPQTLGGKVNTVSKQAVSDWKSGAKTVKQLSKKAIAAGKSIAASIFSKFKK